MSVRDAKKYVTIQNGITNEINSIDFTIKGMGLFSISIRDYLLLQAVKSCIDNNIECYINYGFKK